MNEFDFQHYINGKFQSLSSNTLEVFNPSSGARIGAMPDGDAGLVEQAVAAARSAQTAWGVRPAQERAQYLRKIAQLIRENLPRLARVVATEQGKVLPLAELEIALTAEYLDYNAEWARRIEGEIISSDRAKENILLFRRPMGVVAGILPWNFPMFMVARKVAPALITGNTVVIKPSEEAPYSAYEFARLVAEAEVPTGVFNLIGGTGASVGQALVAHPHVDMVSFTGSSAAGSAIMANAARNVTKVSLELGGKAPSIILADAELDRAVAAVRMAKTMNSGQACNSTERVYIERSVHAEFCEKLAASFESIRYGDPLGGEPVEMGPVINPAAVERIEQLISDARSKGADVLAGGPVDRAEGCYVKPTVISSTTPEMHVLQRELFGPVVLVDAIDDLDEGIARANDSEYGLSSSIFTANLNSAMHAIASLKFGETYVNRENFEAIQGFHAGVRRSGIGGADGKHGLYEYTHTQLAYIQG